MAHDGDKAAMTNLVHESNYLQGARIMLLRILEEYKIMPKIKASRDDAVYLKAEMDAILESPDNARKFLERQKGGYYGWQRDGNGRLTTVKYMFTANKKEADELKRLQQNGK